jgi:hypothetical protein
MKCYSTSLPTDRLAPLNTSSLRYCTSVVIPLTEVRISYCLPLASLLTARLASNYVVSQVDSNQVVIPPTELALTLFLRGGMVDYNSD